MAHHTDKLEILKYPDPALRKVGAKIDRITPQVKEIADQMVRLMNEADGIGLAATQLGVELRLIVVDALRNGTAPLILANPELVYASLEECKNEEGCLSVPGVRALVTRSERINVRAMDMNGKKVKIEADEILSICLQHEIDHLDGKLFIDKLTRLRRSRVLAQYRKLLKKQAEEEN